MLHGKMSCEEREDGERIRPLHPVVPPARAAANVSPSPGGEGRDEGGLLTIMLSPDSLRARDPIFYRLNFRDKNQCLDKI